VYRAAVSDDDRQRRRLGDATRDRIARLEEGWSVPGQASGISPESASSVGRAATDPAEVVPTTPFERPDADGDDRDDAPPEALALLRGATARRSDSEIRRSLTAMRVDPPARPRATPPPPPPAKRPTSPPPTSQAPPGRDDDATAIEPPSALAGRASASVAASAPRALRELPTLRRRRGLLGDLVYVVTVIREVRRARRELLAAEDEITTLKAERASRLADLGRAAIADDRFDQTAVCAARDILSDIEDRRSRHAGAAAAADAELDAIERSRESELRRCGDDLEAAELDVARLDREIAPLERDSAAARKRAAGVKETLAAIDGKIAGARARLVAGKDPGRDVAAIEAELASLRADREAVARDEPAIAAELDALLPRIASLEAQRSDAQARIAAARAAEVDARSRAAEQVAAVQARRRVETRAASDARTASDRALVELGERLYVVRPTDLTLRLGAVESQDVAIATAQRRAIELRELIASVHHGALWRGVVLWILLLAAITAAVAVAVSWRS
jgi:predicted  nucleic acid-binding Zn-ribbon protein